MISFLMLFGMMACVSAGGIDGYTKLMLHMDDTALSDSSSSSHSVTLNGDAARNATQSKFGGYSVYLDGTGDYLSIPDSSDWNFGSGDFTIDFWINATADPMKSAGIVNAWFDAVSNGWGLEMGAKPRFFARNGGADVVDFYTTNPLSNSSWSHLALVRSGNTFTFYINGLKESNASAGGSGVIDNHNAALWVGKRPSYDDLEGHIDELRISKGIARWTANFTPPTGPYSTSVPEFSTITLGLGLIVVLAGLFIIRRKK